METLNGLQTNAAFLEKASKSKPDERRPREMHEVITFLERIGLETSDLDRLNAIHVTGTKGKVLFFTAVHALYLVDLSSRPPMSLCFKA